MGAPQPLCFSWSFLAHLFALLDAGGEGGPRITLALTRYESETLPESACSPLIQEYRGSHDCFIFRPPLPSTVIAAVNHEQNRYQAENVVIHEMRKHGVLVLNPSKSLKLVHRHEEDLRQWLPPVDAKEDSRYARAIPISLAEAFEMARNRNP